MCAELPEAMHCGSAGKPEVRVQLDVLGGTIFSMLEGVFGELAPGQRVHGTGGAVVDNRLWCPENGYRFVIKHISVFNVGCKFLGPTNAGKSAMGMGRRLFTATGSKSSIVGCFSITLF